MGGAGAAAVAVPFVSTFQPSERAKAAGAPVEVDISGIQPGEKMVVEWRGKPVWILGIGSFATVDEAMELRSKADAALTAVPGVHDTPAIVETKTL